VGLNGSKEFLPHHRRGSLDDGGDCYQRRSLSLGAAEAALDRANERIGTPEYAHWYELALKCWRRAHRVRPAQVEGSWHGNDTAWRMVLDLNRIALHGRLDGSLATRPARRIFSLTDALVAGHREGPLAPSPLVLGVITFADEAASADLVHAGLLGFDWQRLALVRESFGAFEWPIARTAPDDCRVSVAGERLTPDQAAHRYGLVAEPPSGWRGHVERRGARSVA